MNPLKAFIDKIKAKKTYPFTLCRDGENLRVSSPNACCNDGDHHVMIVKLKDDIYVLSDQAHTSMRHNYDPRAIKEDVLDYFDVKYDEGELFIWLPNVEVLAFAPDPHVIYYIEQPDGFKELDFAITRFIKALHKIEKMYDPYGDYGKFPKHQEGRTSKGGVNNAPRTLRPKTSPPGQGPRK